MNLKPKPLTAKAFAAYGDVIEATGDPLIINEGFTKRFDDLAQIETSGGHPLVSIFRSTPKPFPLAVTAMERHPLGSQAFVPLSNTPFLILVAAAHKSTLTAANLELFISNGRQGVNYYRNVWHHYCLALGAESDFLVIDRGGPGDNLEITLIDEPVFIENLSTDML